ncbi:hypothetical protein AM501_25995 [Aneurinibacillus migulanus]|uniref:hypothetical protein n=1 Tax=Aneurinibacillus migulanus TaxID=47500 RepID=UPI0005B83344|nr:hypothetical protein [Aneurinibacillus migulanus]KIV57630.1 hypothetical protein TS64_06380 [Aneurinibacillus migulanus]KPD05499.1 hypothetical protein AM501_25995 [Aneurinibacillus migulanus]
MISTRNVIYLKQYKMRKKIEQLKEMIFSKDALLAMLVVIFLMVLCTTAYYGFSHSPATDRMDDNINMWTYRFGSDVGLLK